MIPLALYNESNLVTMSRLPDNSVDAIVTDPPYGLGTPPPIGEVLKAWLAGEVYHATGRGFMGKEWDAFVPGPEIWRECLRVLKPGGHLISFFGTRTYHLGTLAIQLAGFEVRDQLAWIYGCLSEDTEVLTENGWMFYSHIRKSKNIRIFAYNKSTDTYELELPEKWSEYQINDTCFRIKSNFTDQVVSRHHRCLVEREGVLVFETAEQIWEKGSARVPFLEGMSDLSSTVSMCYKGAGCSQSDMFTELRVWDDFDAPEGCSQEKEMRDGGRVRCLWIRDNKAKRLAAKSFSSNVQQEVQWQIAGEESSPVCAQRAGRLDRAINTVIQGEDVRGKQSCMERRGDTWGEEGELWEMENEASKVSNGPYRNGEQRRMGYRGEADCCASDRAGLNAPGMCASHRPQSREQLERELDAIFEQFGPHSFRARSGYKTTLAEVTAIQYNGIVFCPTVSTGAFVARRNGHVFLTGNSGFPKGQDISKAIDKMAGRIEYTTEHIKNVLIGAYVETGMTLAELNERCGFEASGYLRKSSTWASVLPPADKWPVLRDALKLSTEMDTLFEEAKRETVGKRMWSSSTAHFVPGEDHSIRVRLDITAPSSDLAKKYDGWNTNLKPAIEPICLARKPLIGTVAENVMEHGTGGLNIDGCRIPVDMAVDDSRLGGNGKWGTGNAAKNVYSGGYAGKDVASNELGRYPANITHDGSPEVLQFFPSAPGQLAPSRTMPGEKTNSIYGTMNHNSEQMLPRQDESTSAARFFYCAKASSSERGDFNDHPTVKPLSLMKWLVRLVTPPGGVVYDPFAGSGSTLIAAWLEGFDALGSEMDAHYCEVYEKRKGLFPKEQPLF